MWRITFRDLVWRRRRFLIAAAATALVFTITLLLGGVTTAVRGETARIVASFQSDEWWMPAGITGPFSAGVAMREPLADDIAKQSGVRRADPVLLLASVMVDGDDVQNVNVVGRRAGGLGEPSLSSGRQSEADGEAVVDQSLGLHEGDTVTVAGHALIVVGVAKRVSYLFGTPTVFVPLGDAQKLGAAGEPVISAVVVQGHVSDPPPGMHQLDDARVRVDLARPIKSGIETIDMVRSLLTITALGIVGLIIYLSALERTRDVAVLKATGATGRFLATGLIAQGVALTLIAALAASGLANLLAPGFPLELELRRQEYMQLGVLAIVVGVVASLFGVRRAVAIDPALAFGSA
jgi:putative ABC transport system permease protein